MLTLFYSPHMQSTDNALKRASGHADMPLTPEGRQQALALGEHYRAEPLDAIFCSDLQRAFDTARIAFAGRSPTIHADARLRECNYGDFTQFPASQVEAEFPRRIAEPFPRGESLMRVTRRVGAFLDEIAGGYDGKTIVIIGHRATRCALDYWCGESPLEAVVSALWTWRDIPIWRYTLNPDDFHRRFVSESAGDG